MVIQPLIGNPYNGYINPYYWVDDHPLLYGNNGSLDPSTYFSTNKYIIPPKKTLQLHHSWLKKGGNLHQKFDVPSLKLTYRLKIDPWKRRFLLETIVFRGELLVLGSVTRPTYPPPTKINQPTLPPLTFVASERAPGLPDYRLVV